MMKIVLIKLISNIDIVGELAETDDTGVLIKQPYLITVVPNARGVSVGFAPLDFLAEDSVEEMRINFNSMMFGAPQRPKPDLINNYISKRSGIQLQLQ